MAGTAIGRPDRHRVGGGLDGLRGRWSRDRGDECVCGARCIRSRVSFDLYTHCGVRDAIINSKYFVVVDHDGNAVSLDDW